MPVDQSRYPGGWRQLSAFIRSERAGNRCEWIDPDTGERCQAVNGQPSPITGSRVILTVAHVHDPDPANCDPENLLALCQYHHLRLDHPMHMANAAKTRRAKKIAAGQMPLVE